MLSALIFSTTRWFIQRLPTYWIRVV